MHSTSIDFVFKTRVDIASAITFSSPLTSLAVSAMNLLSSPQNRILVLQRFNGYESYPVTLAEWNVYEDRENGMMNLFITLETGPGIVQNEDTISLNGRPQWELNLLEQNLSEESIKVGFIGKIPDSYDDNRGGQLTNFYFCSHEGTDKNVIQIIEVDGDRVRFRLTGETIDVNFYDGSKPPTKLSVDIWFQRDPNGMRSMS